MSAFRPLTAYSPGAMAERAARRTADAALARGTSDVLARHLSALGLDRGAPVVSHVFGQVVAEVQGPALIIEAAL